MIKLKPTGNGAYIKRTAENADSVNAIANAWFSEVTGLAHRQRFRSKVPSFIHFGPDGVIGCADIRPGYTQADSARSVQSIVFEKDVQIGQPDPSLMEPAIQPAPAHEQGGGYDQALRLIDIHERLGRPDWVKMHPEWFKKTPGPLKMSGREYLDSMLTPNIINAIATGLAEKPTDTVTITPEQFKEIWNTYPVNAQHSILDKMDGHIYRESYVMDRRIINHLYSIAPFGVRDILDKHLKQSPFDVSQMLSGEAMLIEDTSCMFNGEIIVKVGDTFLCINKDGNATRYDPGTLITGRKIPAGTTIAFKTA